MELEFLNTEPDFDFSWLPEDLKEPETKNMLSHPEIYDIPRRIAAMRRLREAWKNLPAGSGIEKVRSVCQIDMREWDRKAAA